MQGNYLTIQRSFVYENQLTFQSQIRKIQVITDGKFANISQAINTLIQQFHKVLIFDPQNSKYISLLSVSLNDGMVIPHRFIETQFVMIRYGKRKQQFIKSANNLDQDSSSISSSSSASSQASDHKKQRSKQRTIGQVLNLVKKWRQLHIGNPKQGKSKVNLQQAAKMVGISKKTLDDYYYQLRIGQLENFNFKDNLQEKIGVLRTFIKDYRDGKNSKQYLKHPKNLRIINDLTQSVQPQTVRDQPLVQQPPNIQANPSMDIQNLLNQDNFGKKSYQDIFFADFQFNLDQQDDPFFNFQNAFKKKTQSQDPFYDFLQ